MAPKVKISEDKIEVRREEGGANIDTQLLPVMFNTPEEHLAEMSNIPLAQVYPFAWQETFEAATQLYAQQIAYRKALAKKEADAPDKKPPLVLLSSVWRNSYYRHRRGIDGDLCMMASTLAMKQLEMEQMSQDGDQIMLKRT